MIRRKKNYCNKTDKKDIYQEAGVNEYWIVSPKERAVEIYYLVSGKYKL
ncbi:Uma2 family endonuclease [Blautia sp. 1033sp1_1033st1_G9_1033SCRN_220408]